MTSHIAVNGGFLPLGGTLSEAPTLSFEAPAACAITTTGAAASETATPTKKKALDCRSHAPTEVLPPAKRAKKAKKVGRFGPYPMFLVPCSSCTKQVYTSCKGKTPTCRTCLKKANAKAKADAKAEAKTNARPKVAPNATRH